MIRIIQMITAITTITMITMITVTTESLAHMQSKWPCPYRPFRTPCRRKPSGLPGDNSETRRHCDKAVINVETVVNVEAEDNVVNIT